MIRRKMLDSLLDSLNDDQLSKVTAYVIFLKECDAAGVMPPEQ